MGLISAAVNSVTGVAQSQWKEFFYCDAIPSDILVVKGKKKNTGYSSAARLNDNVISDGSVIAVADGQCMMITEQGKVVDICAESGEYIYDMSSEPSVFTGDLDESVIKVFLEIGKRFSFGGVAGKDQRVYYFNTKEIVGNKYGTPNPVPFRITDKNIGLDIDVGVRCFGEYSYRICNPILFYTNICGNVSDAYSKHNLDGQLRAELLTALQPAFAAISEKGIRYSALPGHAGEICDALNDALAPKWRNLRGIEIVSFGVSSATISEDDEKMIKELQRTAALKDPAIAAAHLAGAQAQAMQAAASNAAGAATGFYAMNMAAQAGGMNAANLFNLASQQAAQNQAPQAAASAGSWTCPSCGTLNQGKFCMECGAKKPAGALKYRCDKCGWVPADPTKPPKFCPECGDPFNTEDIDS
ncbi:MAG: SPFH domain-containing protein [Oscillospiraceae bacterium]|nr:SPFH domain-containing protein [Oscillospiraceae bacterium]